jgi:inositol transport system substrate-binding protein
MEEKKMKRILILMLILALALGTFTACGGGETDAPEETEGVTIAYLSSNMNDTGQTFIADGAVAYAEANGITIDIQDAQEDVVKQQDQVNAMIEKGVDAILVVPVDTSAMGPITDAVTAAGIPLVYVNRNPFGEDAPPEGVYYIGSKEVVAGEIQGNALISLLGETGKVAILMGKLDNEAAVKRTEGNKNILSQYPGIEILAEETGNWQRDQGMALTENWLTAFGDDLTAILANNDEMALGAVQALKTAGRTDVFVLGVDATPDAKAAVGDGSLAGTVLQDLAGQGGGGMEIAFKVLNGETLDQVTWIDFVAVTPENLADFM